MAPPLILAIMTHTCTHQTLPPWLCLRRYNSMLSCVHCVDTIMLLQVSRRMQHRSLLIHRLVSLQSLDGVLVTIEERQNAEMTFGEYHVC